MTTTATRLPGPTWVPELPPLPGAAAAEARRARRARARRAVRLGTALAAVVGLAALPLGDLAADGRAVLAVFGVCVVLWVGTRISETVVAVGGAAATVAVGALAPADVVAAALDPTTALLLAGFVLAAAVEVSGLARSATIALARRAQTVTRLVVLTSVGLAATAFVIPATSGRAALAVPVFLALARAVDDARITRALALVFPTVVLVSAVASLLGAGAHLATAQLVGAATGADLGFARWALLGVPFAAASTALSVTAILHLFLTREERRRRLDVDLPGDGPLDPVAVRPVLTALALAVTGWATGPVHGVDPAIVGVVAAGLLLALGSVTVRQAWSAVSWKLLAFLAATLALGTALVDTGAARWLVGGALGALGPATPPALVVVAVVAVSLLAHLVVTSRTARSTVLIPLVLPLGAATGLDPVALAFASTAAAGYCLSLPASAKPVALFSGLDVPTYSAADLRRLSRVLLPAHLALVVLFSLVVWPALGLPLSPTP